MSQHYLEWNMTNQSSNKKSYPTPRGQRSRRYFWTKTTFFHYILEDQRIHLILIKLLYCLLEEHRIMYFIYQMSVSSMNGPQLDFAKKLQQFDLKHRVHVSTSFTEPRSSLGISPAWEWLSRSIDMTGLESLIMLVTFNSSARPSLPW